MDAFDSNLELNSLDEVKELGTIFANSGFFEDAQEASQAVVKILAGQELGIPPMASMRGIDVIDGNTSLSAAMIGTLIKRHPRYDYRLVGVSREGCKIRFFENGEAIDDVTFTRQDARDANLLSQYNFQNYPKDMFFARCITRGARRHCPEVFVGAVYTPHELGADQSPETPGAVPSDEDTPALPEESSAQQAPQSTSPSKEQKATDQLLGESEPAQEDAATAGHAGDGSPSIPDGGEDSPPDQPLDPSAVTSDNGEGRTNGSTMSDEEQQEARQSAQQRAEKNGAPEATISDAQENRLWAIAKAEDEGQAYEEDALRKMIQSEFGYQVVGKDSEDSIGDIRREDYDAVIEACRDAGLASRYRAPGTADMFGDAEEEKEEQGLKDEIAEEFGLGREECDAVARAIETVRHGLRQADTPEDRSMLASEYLSHVEDDAAHRRQAVVRACEEFDVAALPADFPHRDRLTSASLHTLQQVHDNLRTGALTGISGIGEKRAEEIEQAIGHYDFEVLPEPDSPEPNDPAFAEGTEDEEVPI